MNKQNQQQKQNKEYNQMIERMSPKPNVFKDYIWAFVVEGTICNIGQAFNEIVM